MRVSVGRVNCYHSNRMTRYCCFTPTRLSLMKCACQITSENVFYLQFVTKPRLSRYWEKNEIYRILAAILDDILNISSCPRVAILYPSGARHADR